MDVNIPNSNGNGTQHDGYSSAKGGITDVENPLKHSSDQNESVECERWTEEPA